MRLTEPRRHGWRPGHWPTPVWSAADAGLVVVAGDGREGVSSVVQATKIAPGRRPEVTADIGPRRVLRAVTCVG